MMTPNGKKKDAFTDLHFQFSFICTGIFAVLVYDRESLAHILYVQKAAPRWMEHENSPFQWKSLEQQQQQQTW